jgi:hypothetical protein
VPVLRHPEETKTAICAWPGARRQQKKELFKITQFLPGTGFDVLNLLTIDIIRFWQPEPPPGNKVRSRGVPPFFQRKKIVLD